MNRISNNDFKSLGTRFNNAINNRKFDEAEEVLKLINKSSSSDTATVKYLETVLEYYRDFNKSLKSFDNLFLSNDFNKHTSEGYFFSLKIKPIRRLPINLSVEYPWVPLNPSIIRDGDRYIMNIRVSNYRILPGGRYESLEKDKIIRTRNFIRIMNNNFEEIETYEIIQPERYTRNNWGIKGFEDLRLFKHNDKLKFLSATYDTHNLNVQRVISGTIEDKKIVDVCRSLCVPGIPQHTEKNWLPFIYGSKVYCTYNYHPFTVLDITNPDKIQILNISDNRNNFRSFRGSATPLPYKNGFICLIHQVYTKSDNDKVYLQRFVYFEEFRIKKISHQFYFEDHRIEFCCGMCYDENGNFVFTFGVNDCGAFLYVVDKKTVDSILYDVV